MNSYAKILILLVVNCCYGFTYTHNNFNAGEVSPYIEARTDLGKYYMGCRTYENLFVSPYGAAIRRPGTAYITEVKDSNNNTRLLDFEFSTVQPYILEFGDYYIRFYKDGGQILDANSNPYEIVSPYSQSEVFELQYIQSADVMYIAHPNHPVQQLSRTSHTDWTIEDVNFVHGAFLDENTDENITITPSGTTGSITLTASSDIFDVNNIGGLWQIIHVAEANEFTAELTSATTSATTEVEYGRDWVFTTNGTWTGTIVLERSWDNGSTWFTVSSASYEDNDNIKLSSSEDVKSALYRFNMKSYTSGTCNCSLLKWAMDIKGVARITDVNSATIAQATVLDDIHTVSATSRWAEGAWSIRRGYPKTLTFFQERLCLAGSKFQPQTIWLSKTGDWANFFTNEDDDSAMTFEIASNKVNTIQWILGTTKIFVGTVGSEWAVGGKEEVITPSNPPLVREQSTFGSKYIQALLLNDAVIYAQRTGRKIREFTYSYEKDGYISGDLTILSEQITNSGITQMAYQQQPDSILWIVRQDGELAAMTYEKEQEVFGWHRHTTDGNFKSVASISGQNEDEIWVIIERTINGVNHQYIEQFQPRQFDSISDCFFVDSGLSFDGGAAKTITSITKASPAIISAAAHGFSDGQQVRITDVNGMTEINNKVFTVSNPTLNTFELRTSTDTADYNTVLYSTYTSGGYVQQVEKVFNGLDHLEGKNVIALGDGAIEANSIVSSGQVSLNYWYNKVHIGLPYTSKLKTQRLQVDLQSGTAQTKIKRVNDIILRLYNTGSGLYVGQDEDNLSIVPMRKTTDAMGQAVPLFTGDTDKIYPTSVYNTDGSIYLETSSPLPLNLLAIYTDCEIH